MGVYAQARAGALMVRSATGNPVSLTSPAQLKITTMVAEVWDDLKRAYRSGELQAWLTQCTALDFKGIPRPPANLPPPPGVMGMGMGMGMAPPPPPRPMYNFMG